LNFETRDTSIVIVCGLPAVGLKRKQPSIEQEGNLIGARHNNTQACCLDYVVPFPNVQKKIRSENRRSKASIRAHAGPKDTTKQTWSSDRKTFGNEERLQTCIDALVAELRASITKKKRTARRAPNC